MTNTLQAPAQRIFYRDGQLLAARDLGDEKHRDDLLRWLHVRYLHRTWGIAAGYEVQGAIGDSVVLVAPGYAVDIEGREILSSVAASVPVPAAAGTANYVLTLNHLEDTPRRCCSLDTNSATQDERPSFNWRTPQDVRFGPQIPLVNVKVSDGKIQGTFDFRVRRNAKRFVRPHIAAGLTEPGRTGWEAGLLLNSVEVTVDTSAAGFTRTPMYFAVLTGDFANIRFSPPGATWPSGTNPAFFLHCCCFIASATSSEFTYRIVRARDLQKGLDKAPDAEARGWALQWVGLQTIDGCSPPPIQYP